MSGPRARRALVEYARRSGFSRVLELSRQGAFWLGEGGAASAISAAALRRALASRDGALALSGASDQRSD
jgi:hypothetical protein